MPHVSTAQGGDFLIVAQSFFNSSIGLYYPPTSHSNCNMGLVAASLCPSNLERTSKERSFQSNVGVSIDIHYHEQVGVSIDIHYHEQVYNHCWGSYLMQCPTLQIHDIYTLAINDLYVYLISTLGFTYYNIRHCSFFAHHLPYLCSPSTTH